jgi:GMP synthase (glutamine-hydrolysing)
MPRLLILNHHGGSVPTLIERVTETGANFVVFEPRDVNRWSAAGFDGVIASGGHLSAETYRRDLAVYSSFLDELKLPFLGICLGLKILGHHYGARMRRIPLAIGTSVVHFEREYPLAPGVRDCTVYQSHKYELLLPLPYALENYASDGSPVQAVKVRGAQRYGLQFHPEMSDYPARSIVEKFVSLCAEARSAQGT